MKNKEIKELEEDKEEKNTDKKATNTAFILIFPALILAGIAVYYAPPAAAFIVVLLSIYQFLMLKKFIQDYYRDR